MSIDAVKQATIDALRSEVAALRRERDDAADQGRASVYLLERELAEARALLVRWLAWYDCPDEEVCQACAHEAQDTRAFLRGDEARRLTEPEKP